MLFTCSQLKQLFINTKPALFLSSEGIKKNCPKYDISDARLKLHG